MKKERAVLIRYCNSAGDKRRASGLQIGGTYVLTADHCVSGTGHIVVVNGIEYPAEVHVRSNSLEVDIAVLDVPRLPKMDQVQIRIIDQQDLSHLDQMSASGFPHWKKNPREATSKLSKYILAYVRGTVPTSENTPAYGSTAALLSFKVTDPDVIAPIIQGNLDQPESMWAGFSGAGVITADDFLVGVICSHTCSEGSRALTLSSLEKIKELDSETAQRFWQALGISDPDQVPRIPNRMLVGNGTSVSPLDLQDFTSHVKRYCLALPHWVPKRLSFRRIWQQLDLVSSPMSNANAAGWTPSSVPSRPETSGTGPINVNSGPAEGQVASTIFLVSGPGTGKSWYLRHLALEAADRYSPTNSLNLVPVLVNARLLENALAKITEVSLGFSALAAAIVEAIPHGLAGALKEAQLNGLKQHLETNATLLLIDGYDEIPQTGAKLGEFLPRICSMISTNAGRVIVTSRPASLPNGWDISAEWLGLRPLTLQQRIEFVQAWFEDDENRSHRITTWLRTNRFEALSSPLLLTLFCSEAQWDPDDAPLAGAEHTLWANALQFLASQSHHDRPLAPQSSKARHRIALLTAVARLFVRDTEIAIEIDAEEIRRKLNQSKSWNDIQRDCDTSDPLEDLLDSGVVYLSESRRFTTVGFFHSACRDYLIAASLDRGNDWMDFVPRIWSQTEWEPVFRYLGAVHSRPNEILQTLVWNFESDPFNAARFAAGGVIAAAKADVLDDNLQRQVINELLIIVGSSDAADARRAVLMLASIGSDTILESFASLLNAARLARIRILAIEALSAWSYDTATHALRGVVQSRDFTDREREAAVKSIAQVGTELAGSLMCDFAEGQDLPAPVRVTAAIWALRSFNDASGTLSILKGSFDSDLASQRLLAERLATDTECLRAVLLESDYDWRKVPDPYAAAVLGWTQSETAGRAEFVSRVPSSPGVRLSLQRITELYRKTESDFAFASFLLFVFEKRGQDSARRLASIWPHVAQATTCEQAWFNFISENVQESTQIGARFLARISISGPVELQERISAGVANGLFPQIVESFIQIFQKENIERNAQEQHDLSDETRPRRMAESKLPSVAELLRSNSPSAERYAMLRGRQRELGIDHRVFESVALLTDKVSTKYSSEWIDCLPVVAPALEVRLIHARNTHRSCEIELANLRAHWPGRWQEAIITSLDPEPEILSAVATAYFIAGDYENAQTSALAAIGAATVRATGDSRHTVIVLAGSSSKVGGFNELVFPWVLRRAKDQSAGVHSRVAAAWCLLTADPGAARKICDELPRWAQARSADFFALKYCLDGEWPDDISSLQSWFDVQRTQHALMTMFDDTTQEEVRIRARRAADLLKAIAASLSKSWPPPKTHSPTEIGRERWHWAVSSRAVDLLLDGKLEDAAKLYQTLERDLPDDAILLNNYGFCMMAIDSEIASAKLKEAASIFGYPWLVNVANRMLLHYRRGEYADALRLGQSYAEGGGSLSGTTATLWDIDDPRKIVDPVDPEEYVIGIAKRCLIYENDEEIINFWRRYIRSHSVTKVGGNADFI